MSNHFAGNRRQFQTYRTTAILPPVYRKDSEKMKVLLIGSGGREHALAWKLASSPRVTALYAWPGNPGIEPLAELVSGKLDDFAGIEKFARNQAIDLVVIGPEDPLANGLVDRLEAAGLKAFGPTRDAARIEADKWFAKEIMR